MAAFIHAPVGANPAVAHASGDQQYAAGTLGHGSSGTEWVYVQAAGSIAQYDFVTLDENYQAVGMTLTTGALGHLVGIAQIAMADNEWAWVARRGSDIQGNTLTSCLPDVLLWATATAGHLDDISASAGSVEVVGIVLVATQSGAAGNQEVIAHYPHVDLTS